MRLWPSLLRRVPWHALLVLSALCAGAGCCNADAQEPSSAKVEGYVTAAHVPDGFDVNGEHVTVEPETQYRFFGSKRSDQATDQAILDTLHTQMRVGMFVRVIGDRSNSIGGIIAASVLVRDDLDRVLRGFGVIDTVIGSKEEPIYQADGYRIRITSNTALSYGGGLKSLADVGTNTWIKYQGQVANGVLLASQAKFFPAHSDKLVDFLPLKPPSPSGAAPQAVVPVEGARIDADGHLVNLHAKVRPTEGEGVCEWWHKVSGDPVLQDRVLRIGNRLVPAFQKQLKADDTSKIPFRFYVVEEDKIHSELTCNAGLILIPRQAMERLDNDDQLAALLADGIAYNFQWQAAFLCKQYQSLLLDFADYATTFIPEGLVGVAVGSLVEKRSRDLRMEEQRSRIALTLMADGGYDPWQAPEAWRLVAQKKLPPKKDSLRYPNRSGYQFEILSLEFPSAQVKSDPSR